MHQYYYNHYNDYTQEYYQWGFQTISLGPEGSRITQTYNGSYTIDTTQVQFRNYVDNLGMPAFNAYAFLSTTEDTYYYVSPYARIKMGNTNPLTGINDMNTLSFQSYNEETNTWTGSGEYALGGSGGLAQYTSLYWTSWISKSDPLQCKIVVIGNRADDSTKWDMEWMTFSLLTPNFFTMSKKDKNYPEDEPEYDDGTDDGSDDIGIPDEPIYGILSSHMVHAYVMSEADMINLSALLWDISGSGFVDTIAKYFNDPAQAIISTHIVPITPNQSSIATPVKIGNWTSAGLSAKYITNEYSLFDCGNFTLNGLWGSYLDYRSTVDIYLPFIGIKSLATEDVMNSKLNLQYRINTVSGACVAYIRCTKTKKGEENDVLDSLVYQFSGNCAFHIPTTNADYSNQIVGAFNALSSMANSISSAVSNKDVSQLTSGTTQAMGDVLSMRMSYRTNGGVFSDVGMMSSMTPFLIVSEPNATMPSSFERDEGRSAGLTRSVGGLEGAGFTQFEAVIMQGLTCTDEERDEIERILKEGIYL